MLAQKQENTLSRHILQSVPRAFVAWDVIDWPAQQLAWASIDRVPVSWCFIRCRNIVDNLRENEKLGTIWRHALADTTYWWAQAVSSGQQKNETRALKWLFMLPQLLLRYTDKKEMKEQVRRKRPSGQRKKDIAVAEEWADEFKGKEVELFRTNRATLLDSVSVIHQQREAMKPNGRSRKARLVYSEKIDRTLRKAIDLVTQPETGPKEILQASDLLASQFHVCNRDKASVVKLLTTVGVRGTVSELLTELGFFQDTSDAIENKKQTESKLAWKLKHKLALKPGHLMPSYLFNGLHQRHIRTQTIMCCTRTLQQLTLLVSILALAACCDLQCLYSLGRGEYE